MNLPSTYEFQGWSVRYSLLEGSNTSPNSGQRQKVKQAVFVHGTPWSSVVYRPIIETLIARGSHRVLVYDLPGYGQSQVFKADSTRLVSEDDFEGDTSVKFQAEALTALLKHTRLDGKHGNPAPTVIAHDIAGTIVLRAHLLHGCDFESMVLLDTNTVLPWGDGFYKLARSEPGPFLKLPPMIFEAMVRAVIQSACHNPKVLQAGWEDALAQPWISQTLGDTASIDRQKSFVRQIAQANDGDVAEMLERNLYADVRCDVKIMWGEQDQWIPEEKIKELIKRLNGKVKECVFIPEAGHLVMLDQPARVTVELFSWLSR